MAGIWEEAVACVPLVSLPVALSALSAARAPPDLTPSDVVKYGLPRFFGMTKTFRPVFSGGAAAAVVAATNAPARHKTPSDASCTFTRPFT